MDDTNKYRPESARIVAESRTCLGKNPELSMTASQRRPSSAARSPSRSPTSFSSSGKRCVLVRPRLKRVTVCPRATAYSTMWGPMNPVPPSTRMVIGVGVSSPWSPYGAQAAPRPRAPAAAAVVFRNSRRFCTNISRCLGNGDARHCAEPVVRVAPPRTLPKRRTDKVGTRCAFRNSGLQGLGGWMEGYHS